MPKVACSVCKKRVERDSLYRSSGMSKVCSEDCYRRSFLQERKDAKVENRAPRKVKRPSEPSNATRQKVLKRDNGKCRYCGLPTNVLHHVEYRSERKPNPHDERNLIALCPEHHDLVHSNKRFWQPVLKRALAMFYDGETSNVSIRKAKREGSREDPAGG